MVGAIAGPPWHPSTPGVSWSYITTSTFGRSLAMCVRGYWTAISPDVDVDRGGADRVGAKMRRVPATTTPAGVTVHYEVAGDGTPVVLVHGLAESGEVWRPVTDRLSATKRVVVVDLPGHGRSGASGSYDIVNLAADVAAVITADGLDGSAGGRSFARRRRGVGARGE